MKLIIEFKNPYQSKKTLLPRDIRNYFASISKENKELNELVMWHKREQPTFIFSKPNPKGFALYTFKNDILTILAIETLKELVEKNPLIYVNDEILEVEKVRIVRNDYTSFKSGLFDRRLRSPMIITCSKYGYMRARQLSKDGKIDYAELESMVKDTIIETVATQTKEWLGKEIDISDAIIKFKELEYVPVRYKDNEYYPAIRGSIISNIELPQFLGYKCGMGYGELSTIREMEFRKGANEK